MRATLAVLLFVLLAGVLGCHPQCRNSQGEVRDMECTARVLPPNCTTECDTEEMRKGCYPRAFSCYVRNRYDTTEVCEMDACPDRPIRCHHNPICKTGSHCRNACTDSVAGWECYSPGDDWICDAVPCSWESVIAAYRAGDDHPYTTVPTDDPAPAQDGSASAEPQAVLEAEVTVPGAGEPSPDAGALQEAEPHLPGVFEQIAQQQPAEEPVPEEVPANIPEEPVAEVVPEPVVEPVAEVQPEPVAEVPQEPVAEVPQEPVVVAPAEPVVEAPVLPVTVGVPNVEIEPTEPAIEEPEALPQQEQPVVEQVNQVPNYETTGWE